MKFERISDTQIKCLITNTDLLKYKIDINTFSYGSDHARRLFTEIIQEAQTTFDFPLNEHDLYTIEAIPMSHNSIAIFITQVDDPELLDSRFSKFSEDLSPTSSQNDSSEESFLDKLNAYLEGDIPVSLSPDRVCLFNSLDEAISFSKLLVNYTCIWDSLLYKKQQAKQYALLLNLNLGESTQLALDNLLTEFSFFKELDYSNLAYLNEHFELMINDQAHVRLSKI